MSRPPTPTSDSLALLPNDDDNGGVFLIQGVPHTADAAIQLVRATIAEGIDATDTLVINCMNRRDRDTLLLGLVLSEADRAYGTAYIERVAAHYNRSASGLYSFVQVIEKFGFKKAAQWMAETGTVFMSHLTWLAADGRTPDQVNRGIELALAGYSVRQMRDEVLGESGENVIIQWRTRLSRFSDNLRRLARRRDAPFSEARALRRLADALPREGFLPKLAQWLEEHPDE